MDARALKVGQVVSEDEEAEAAVPTVSAFARTHAKVCFLFDMLQYVGGKPKCLACGKARLV